MKKCIDTSAVIVTLCMEVGDTSIERLSDMVTLWTRFLSVLRDWWTFTSIVTEWGPILATLITEDKRKIKKFPKTVFFIRHPHTNDEADGIYRGDHAEITPQGWEEAAIVARRIADMGVTHIVTSTLPRSRKLANIIVCECQVAAAPNTLPVVIESGLFVECKKPSELVNRSRKDPHALRVMERIRKYFDWFYRYSDEENRWRLEFRVWHAMRMLAELETDCVVVVTHGKFLRAIWHYVYEQSLDGFYRKADRLMRHDHTGITIIALKPSYRRGSLQWNLESWNDVAHTKAFIQSNVLRDLAARP